MSAAGDSDLQRKTGAAGRCRQAGVVGRLGRKPKPTKTSGSGPTITPTCSARSGGGCATANSSPRPDQDAGCRRFAETAELDRLGACSEWTWLTIGLRLWAGGDKPGLPTDVTMEVHHASYYRNAGSCLQDPGTRWIFRKEHRRCHPECHNPRIKDRSRDEMVRSRANARPYRKRVCSPLPGRLASWIYTRGVMLGQSPLTPSCKALGVAIPTALLARADEGD
jgi:hypothetical protein